MGEKNYGKSVRAKLLNISKAEKLGYQLIVIRYIQERLLYRLSQSRFREKLFLKGGALLYALEQFRARPTLDIDFLGDKISRDKEFVKMAFEEICAVSCPEDFCARPKTCPSTVISGQLTILSFICILKV